MGLFGVLRNGRATTAGGFQQLCDAQATERSMALRKRRIGTLVSGAHTIHRGCGIEPMNTAGTVP
jgi:hypothetical protein